MKLLSLLYAGLCLWQTTVAAEDNSRENNGRKGSLFIYWGYNRSYYSPSNLHFTGRNYDFTLYDVKASDRPSKFGWVYVNPATISIPQYNYRVGYFLTNRFAISAGLDHMKYVVNEDQETRISGIIKADASATYAGSYLNEPIKLKRDLLLFEHTDGFNFTSLDVEYLQPVLSILDDDISLSWNAGIGGIWAITRTDVRIMGEGINNDFHIAGYALALKTGPRVEYKKRVFLAAEAKGGYASLPSVLINNDAPEIGDHNFYFLEYYVIAGVNFRIGRLFKRE